MKLLFLGFDGLDGARTLADGGVFADWPGLRAICEPEIASAGPSWMTIYTGLKTHQHGVTDTWGRNADTCADRIWDILCADGYRCGVIGMPVTWPAQPLDGWMMSGVPVRHMGEPMAFWPEDLDIYGYIPDYMNVVMPAGPEVGQWRINVKSLPSAWNVMRNVAWNHVRIAARTYKDDRVDCLFCGFAFPDRFGHIAGQYGTVTAAQWEPIDALAAEITYLMRVRLDPDVTAVISDHGFGPGGHTKDGLFLLAKRRMRRRNIQMYNWDVMKRVLEAIG